MFVLAYSNDGTAAQVRIYMNNRRAYTLPWVKLTKFNVLVDGRNFYDQPISSDTKKYEELLKMTNRRGKSYERGCLLDFNYYKKHYSIITCNLSRQKALDPNPKIALQLEIVFMLGINAQILTILEKSKKTEFSKGTTKVL